MGSVRMARAQVQHKRRVVRVACAEPRAARDRYLIPRSSASPASRCGRARHCAGTLSASRAGGRCLATQPSPRTSPPRRLVALFPRPPWTYRRPCCASTARRTRHTATVRTSSACPTPGIRPSAAGMSTTALTVCSTWPANTCSPSTFGASAAGETEDWPIDQAPHGPTRAAPLARNWRSSPSSRSRAQASRPSRCSGEDAALPLAQARGRPACRGAQARPQHLRRRRLARPRRLARR